MLFQNVGEEKVEDLLILVDDNDNEIGYGEKMETHIMGRLHRAFSLFGGQVSFRRLVDKFMLLASKKRRGSSGCSCAQGL